MRLSLRTLTPASKAAKFTHGRVVSLDRPGSNWRPCRWPLPTPLL